MNDYTDFPALLEERYSEKISFTLIRDDAEEFSRSHSLEECCDMGLALYESGNYQVQEAGVFMLGDCAAENDDALLRLFDVAPVTRLVLTDALAIGFADYEDAVLHEAARHADVQVIVTRNVRDFSGAIVPVLPPDEFLLAWRKI